MDEFCIIPVGGVQLYLLLLGQRETVPHRACCREALTAEVFVRHASRRLSRYLAGHGSVLLEGRRVLLTSGVGRDTCFLMPGPGNPFHMCSLGMGTVTGQRKWADSGEGMADKMVGAEGWIGESFKRRKQLGIAGHMFNPSIQEAEKGRSL